MKAYILSLFIMIGSKSAFASPLTIEADSNGCMNGMITMSVDVKYNDERFSYYPSCDFSYNNAFVTTTGLTCNVSAGMCSGFSPENKFEVQCSDGSQDSFEIACPQSN